MLCFSEYICSLSLCKAIQIDHTIRLRYHTGLTRKEKILFRETFSENLFRQKYLFIQSHFHQNSFDIKQEFPDSTHRESSQNPNENSAIHSPSTKKYCPRHWELSLDALNLPIVQRLYKVLWKAQITRSCFAFWAARYDCASKAYIFTQLPPPQDLTTASNTFPQLFKISFQFIIQKLEGQKLVHWEIKPWSKEEQKSGFW